MEQDSEMQRAIEGLDSFEADGPSQRPGTRHFTINVPLLTCFLTSFVPSITIIQSRDSASILPLENPAPPSVTISHSVTGIPSQIAFI